MHKHILIATDGSDLATKALQHGLDLARQLGARATIVTDTEMWSVIEMTRHARDRKNPIEAYEELAEAHAAKVLSAASEAAKQAGVPFDTVHMKDLKPAEAIVHAAEKHGCDLIVMASHGRSGVNKLLLGSVTARVLALTAIPVLVYR